MYRLHLTALAAALALFMAGAASAAPKSAKSEKKEKAASASKPAIMECCAKGGCATCEVGNSAFFTEHACTQCAAGVADVAKHSHGDEHTMLSHGNAAFFTAIACSAKEENGGSSIGTSAKKTAASKAKK